MELDSLLLRNNSRADAAAALYSACQSLPLIKGIKGTNGAPTHIVSHPSVNAGSPNQDTHPVRRRNSHSTQRLPVMGLAARAIWINQGIRHGNVVESQQLRGRETVLEAQYINCEDMRMLSARTGDKLRAISEVARKGRRVKDLRRLMNHPDLWMQAYLNIQGNKGALTRGTDKTTMDGYSPERAANLVELIRERRYKPKPVRRATIPTKVAGKMRPLGLPSRKAS